MIRVRCEECINQGCHMNGRAPQSTDGYVWCTRFVSAPSTTADVVLHPVNAEIIRLRGLVDTLEEERSKTAVELEQTKALYRAAANEVARLIEAKALLQAQLANAEEDRQDALDREEAEFCDGEGWRQELSGRLRRIEKFLGGIGFEA